MADLFDLEAQQPRFNERIHTRSSSSSRTTTNHAPTLPSPAAIRAAEASLPDPTAPSYLAGRAPQDVAAHIVADLVPAMDGHAGSPRYYGFVTGGVLPIAEWADNVVARVDQNVQVRVPGESVATGVEDAALGMVVRLLRLDGAGGRPGGTGTGTGTATQTGTPVGSGAGWAGRTFTTGATAGNVLGLACGREAVLERRLRGVSVGEAGILAACSSAGVRGIRVLSSAPHSSLYKAASVVGLGRASVVQVACGERPWKLDLDAVERELRREGIASVVCVSGGEVNTGRYALDDIREWERLRGMADRYGAWIHLDGAFGIFSRVLDGRDEYRLLHVRNEGFRLADSIALDCHKILNVPYDCGVFLTRSASLLHSVFQNPNAAYLSPTGPSAANADAIPSPLNIGIENSRRFRALPVYAALMTEGRAGFASLVHNMVQLSRRVAGFLRASPHFELLPHDADADADTALHEIFMVVLFRARDGQLNDGLVERVNSTREMYVSGTTWKGQKAVRMAVSSWKVDVERDAAHVIAILEGIASSHRPSATSACSPPAASVGAGRDQ